MLRQIECVISGRVQKVLYRDFARRAARRLGIVGTVQNAPDGTVRVIAQADESELKEYISLLKKGSMFSRVDTCEIKWSISQPAFSDFTILYKNFSDRL